MSIQKHLGSVVNFLSEEDGTTAVEYAVMMAMILLALVGSVYALAFATRDSFDASASAISTAFSN